MNIGKRGLKKLFSALGEKRHYAAARRMLQVYQHPLDGFQRYLFGTGKYPADIPIRTPAGPLTISTYSYDDVLTINEIFCRRDYPTFPGDRIVVDFGSNIGISAAYFLTAAPQSFCYLYEPLPTNIERLKHNLRRFTKRYELHEAAVGEADGEVQFGWEKSGRYGGVGKATGNYLTVHCLDSNRILEEVIARHGKIDILKIDIETLERQVTERIPLEIARLIDRVYVEYKFASNPLATTHASRLYGIVTQFENRATTREQHIVPGLVANSRS